MNIIANVDQTLTVNLPQPAISKISHLLGDFFPSKKLPKETIQNILNTTASWGRKDLNDIKTIQLPFFLSPFEYMYTSWILSMRSVHLFFLERSQTEQTAQDLTKQIVDKLSREIPNQSFSEDNIVNTTFKTFVSQIMLKKLPTTSRGLNSREAGREILHRGLRSAVAWGIRFGTPFLLHQYLQPSASFMFSTMLATACLWPWTMALSQRARKELETSGGTLVKEMSLSSQEQMDIINEVKRLFKLDHVKEETLQSLTLRAVVKTPFERVKIEEPKKKRTKEKKVASKPVSGNIEEAKKKVEQAIEARKKFTKNTTDWFKVDAEVHSAAIAFYQLQEPTEEALTFIVTEEKKKILSQGNYLFLKNGYTEAQEYLKKEEKRLDDMKKNETFINVKEALSEARIAILKEMLELKPSPPSTTLPCSSNFLPLTTDEADEKTEQGSSLILRRKDTKKRRKEGKEEVTDPQPPKKNSGSFTLSDSDEG